MVDRPWGANRQNRYKIVRNNSDNLINVLHGTIFKTKVTPDGAELSTAGGGGCGVPSLSAPVRNCELKANQP